MCLSVHHITIYHQNQFENDTESNCLLKLPQKRGKLLPSVALRCRLLPGVALRCRLRVKEAFMNLGRRRVPGDCFGYVVIFPETLCAS